MTKRIVEETIQENQNSISLELDSRGMLKPSVKFYFEDREDWRTEANRALDALSFLIREWRNDEGK